jgi:hypothetical protein
MNNPTPQQNQIVAPQQKMDTQVMDLIQRKGSKAYPDEVTESKKRLATLIKQFNIDPKLLIQAGKYAKSAARDPKMYPVALQAVMKSGLLTPEQVPNGNQVDYNLIQTGIAVGKMAEELMNEGKI